MSILLRNAERGGKAREANAKVSFQLVAQLVSFREEQIRIQVKNLRSQRNLLNDVQDDKPVAKAVTRPGDDFVRVTALEIFGQQENFIATCFRLEAQRARFA